MSLPVSDDQRAVLEALYAHRLMTTPQLRLLHTPAGETRTGKWIRELMRDLYDGGFVSRARRHRRQCYRWYLTEAGAELVEAATATPRDRRVLLSKAGAGGALQSHTLAVNQVGIAFSRWARRLGHDCGPHSWQHEVAHRLDDRRRGGQLLIPDAVLHYVFREDPSDVAFLYRFVELDRNTMPPQRVGDKLRRYARYASRMVTVETGGRVPAWQRRYPTLPSLLVVLAGSPRPQLEARRQHLVGLWQADPALQVEAGPPTSVVLLEDLEDCGPLAPIFTPVEAPRRREDLLGRPPADLRPVREGVA